jgi:eukaryotic-like serine/threonine-protein kinase
MAMKNDSTVILLARPACPECGQALPPDSPRGLCSRCLLGRALAGADASAPLPEAAPAPAQPIRLGDCELREPIAQGGMGVVYRAWDTRLHRLVALKMLGSGQLATAAEVERFKIEAEAAARLEHPNIVPIYEVGDAAGRHFFTMKYVEGGSLAQAIGGNPLPAPRAARLLAKVARAVHYAHQRGVLHRDLKPNNILLDTGDEPQLTDFGLAKIMAHDAALTRSVAVMGSASYMAPEQARGQTRQITTAADIYSLGAVLYETLTGRPPFDGATMVETLRRVAEDEPRPPRVFNPAVPADLETICLKCLEKEPGRRYATAQELAEDLDRFLRVEPIQARPATARERLVKWVRRKPAIAALAAAVVAVAALGFLAVLWQLQKTKAALRLAEQNALAEATARAPVLSSRFVLTHGKPVVSAVFSPDGQRILTASEDETAALWDAGTGGLVHKLEGHSGVLASAVFSDDGRRVLTWSFDTHTRYASLNPAGEPLFSHTTHQYGDQSARLWDAETGGLITLLTNTGAQISSAALSPDGRLIVTAGYDNTARLWDAQSGQLRHSLTGHTAAILSAQFTPDGRRVLTTSDGTKYQLKFERGPGYSGTSSGSSSAYEDEIARLWDVATGKQVGGLKNQAGSGFFGRGDSNTKARFSSDGRWIVTAPALLENFGLWDARTGALRARLRGHRHEINDALFSPDGQRIVTASADNTARLWDAHTGRPLAVLTAHDAPVLAADFSPDGRRFATASADGTVRVWETATGKGLAVMRGHDGKVYSVRFSPDGARLVSASEDGTARVWDSATLEQLSLVLTGHRGEVTSVSFSADSRRALTASADRTARVWDTANGRLISELKGLASLKDNGARDTILGRVESAAFSPDGRLVVTASDDQQAAMVSRFSLGFRRPPGPAWPPPGAKALPFAPGRLFETQTGREVLALPADGCGLKSAVFSPDGTRVLTVSNGRLRRATVRPGGGCNSSLSSNKPGQPDVQLWEAKTGQLLTTLGVHTNGARFAIFSPDGRKILTADQYRLRLWDAATGQELPPLEKPSQPAYASFSPDSQRILADDWGTAAIWNAGTGRRQLRLKELEGQVTCAAFSPDGAKVALAGRLGSAALCDAATGQRLMGFQGKKNALGLLLFSPNGRLVVGLDQTREVRVWSTLAGQTMSQPVVVLDAHKDIVLHAAFSPDGKWLGTASKDFTARLWPVSALPAGLRPQPE